VAGGVCCDCYWQQWEAAVAKVEELSRNQGEDKGQNTTEQHHMARVVPPM